MAKENIERLTYLTEKIVNEEPLSVEEAGELETFLSSNPRFRSEYQRRIDRSRLDSAMAVFIRAKTNWRNKFDGVLSRGKISRLRQRSFPLWQYYSASAAILIFLVAGLVIVVGRHKKVREAPVVSKVQDIKPGGNRAILTLADGSSVVLDSARNGVLAQQGSSKIVKLANGQLAYKTEDKFGDASDDRDRAIAYNTVSTPAGGTYQVNLPDGSKVWLNAASSIRFPAVYTGARRDVEITGEAYFEVASNKLKPFRVLAAGQEIKVLGTSFNITAYKDESTIRTALVEGAVMVTSGPWTVKLRPGQQAANRTAADRLEVSTVNTNSVTAWRKGFFSFDNAGASVILKQLARWYDVEIVHEGELPSVHLDGMISRDLNLSEVTKVLETHDIHCRIEEHKLIVSPK